jgi:hypothetical protein
MADKVVGYKGKNYKLLYEGKTKFGVRAHLAFMDGSKDFWVDAKLLEGAVSEGGKSTGGGASDKQLKTLRGALRKLERVMQFDSFSGSGADVAADIHADIQKLGGMDKLTSKQASEFISQAFGMLDDEM